MPGGLKHTYWAKFKSRNTELLTICHQLKLKAADGKYYLTDVVDESGLNMVIALIPGKKIEVFVRWMKNLENSLDEKSKLKAYELFDSGFINNIEIGTVKGVAADSRIYFRWPLRFCRTDSYSEYC